MFTLPLPQSMLIPFPAGGLALPPRSQPAAVNQTRLTETVKQVKDGHPLVRRDREVNWFIGCLSNIKRGPSNTDLSPCVAPPTSGGLAANSITVAGQRPCVNHLHQIIARFFQNVANSIIIDEDGLDAEQDMPIAMQMRFQLD